jgi:hypothetical protein
LDKISCFCYYNLIKFKIKELVVERSGIYGRDFSASKGIFPAKDPVGHFRIKLLTSQSVSITPLYLKSISNFMERT